MSSRFSNPLLPIAMATVIGFMLLQLDPVHAADKNSGKHAAATGIAWIAGKSEVAVNAVFAKARSEAKPVLLYWGAKWCPPCNQLKATLFNRQDFIALTRALVPVYLDGDSPGAQKLGSRFKVAGYPTLILYSPQGTEITRLPGETDAQRITQTLQAGLAGGRAAKAVLADAQAGKTLPASEWNALAFYSWDTDEAQLVTREQRAAVLGDLAQLSRSVSPEASTRLWLKSLVEGKAGYADKLPGALPDQRERLSNLLRNSNAIRMFADVLMVGAGTIVRSLYVAADVQRARMADEYDAALAGLQNDPQLSRADRTGALIARVDLARVDIADDIVNVSLPESLLAEVRALALGMDAEISNGYERQAVIPSVAELHGKAGLWSESDALLLSNLKKSHSPYYLMSQLGGNARKLGHSAEALQWFERAYQASKGPATRLQWGTNYVAALLDLAPQETVRIEKVVSNLFAVAARDPDVYYGRSGRSLKRMIGKLVAWSGSSEQAAVVARLRAHHGGVCLRIAVDDPRRSLCEAIWAAA